VLSPRTAQRIELGQAQRIEVRTAKGSIVLPVELAEMPDDVVWLPTDSGTSRVHRALGAGHGSLVDITATTPMSPAATNGHGTTHLDGGRA
ncbi:molybdopterin dinucleotide binding domain-containing protein, partial [Saccharopolyspora kobensis]